MAVPRPPYNALLALLAVVSTAVPAPAPAQSPPGADMDWRGGVVQGRIVDAETGEGIPGETIRLTWITTHGSSRYPYPWVPEIEQGRAPGTEAHSDADGHFRFGGLGAGRLRLRAGLPLASPIPVQEITRDDPAVAVELRISLGRHVRGTVLRPDGEPAAGAFVFLSGREAADGTNALWDERPHGREADWEGAYLLAGLPPGILWIEAFHSDHGFSSPVSVDDDPEELPLQLREEADRLVSLERRSFGGIGIQIGGSAIGPRIEGVTEGLPAHAAGLRAGDVIGAIDGCETRFMVRDEFIMRCRGPAGSRVRLRIDRAGESREVELVRVDLE